MTQTHPAGISARTSARAETSSKPVRRSRWPLSLAAAGLLSGIAAAGPGLSTALDPVDHRVSTVLGHLAAVLLLVAAAQWRRRVEPRVPSSTATHLVPLGLVAAAVGPAHGWTGWVGVAAAAGGVAWMALRERTVSRWVGVVSLLAVLQTIFVAVGPEVPGLALPAPTWLLVTGVGLAFGRSTIAR